MRWNALLLCALAGLVALALPTYATTRQQEKLFADAAASSDGVLRVDEAQYEALVASPRDYSVTVLYSTESPQFQCAACSMFREPYRMVSRGWKAKKRDRRHVFTTLNAEDAMDVFRREKFTHIPVIRSFPATAGAHAASSRGNTDYDVTREGLDADSFADSMSSFLGTTLRPKKPLLTMTMVFRAAVVLGVVVMGVIVVPRLNSQSGLRSLAMLATLGLVFTFTSGYMWNRIRGPPFLPVSADGSPEFIARGLQTQHGVESPIIIGLCASGINAQLTADAALALCVLLLTNVAPSMQSTGAQRFVVMLGLVGLLGLFSLLIDVYRRKNPMYPFRLLL
ncbi:oligosaccharyl transferase subunit ost3/OST6 [Malassezia sp. CBS 17886]|nr:oligosaccharyl transferase subunit ost3/OST6 [Malassezia sp. CBS 17886]